MARRWAVVPVRAPRLRSAGAAWRRIAEAPTSPDRARAARGAVLRREDCLTDRGRAALAGGSSAAAQGQLSSRATIAARPPQRLRRRVAPAGGSGSFQQFTWRESPLTPALSLGGARRGRGSSCLVARVPPHPPSPPLRGGEGEMLPSLRDQRARRSSDARGAYRRAQRNSRRY